MNPDDLLNRAFELDSADPLAHWRDRFVIDDPDLSYLDGNSLGMLPRTTVHRIHEVMNDEWGSGLIRSWRKWLELPLIVGNELAPLLGADDGEVVVHDSTSVNLHQLLHAAVRLRPERAHIAVDAHEFPTDRYAVEAIAAEYGLTVISPKPDESLDELDLSNCSVVVRSLIDYRTAVIADLDGFTHRARQEGALVIWDLSHAVGAIELDLHAADVDMAIGCTYKYLNGGPGAPAFSYVRSSLISDVDQPIRGWFGQDNQFAMDGAWSPKPGIGRLMIGTPSILALEAARCGIEVSSEAGMPAIAAKGRALTEFAHECCDEMDLESVSPRDASMRGSHIAIRHPNAKELTERLEREHLVIADYRDPDLVRLGCSALTTRFGDVARAVTRLAEMVHQ
jgi:kynureninase